MNIRFMAALDHMISHQEAEEVLPEKVPSSLVRKIKNEIKQTPTIIHIMTKSCGEKPKGNKHIQCLL